MKSNTEKFGISSSMRKKDLDEGIAEYREQQEEKVGRYEDQERALEKWCNAFIDEYYSSALATADFLDLKRPETFSQRARDVIFERWFERDPHLVLANISQLGKLSPSFQPKIARHLQERGGYIGDQLFEPFDQISDPELLSYLVNNQIDFSLLARNKEKLSGITDDQILAQLQLPAGYDWSSLVPFIDKFPSVDKKEVIEGVLKQSDHRARPENLFFYREKLGLSIDDLIDAFYRYKKMDILCAQLKSIDSKYHKEIIQKTLETGAGDSLIYSLENLHGIDLTWLAEKLIDHGFGSLVANYFQKFHGVNGEHIFELLANRRISNIIQNFSKFQIADHLWALSVLVEKGFEREVPGLLKQYPNVDQVAVAELMMKHGFSRIVAYQLSAFQHLNQHIAMELISGKFEGELFKHLDSFDIPDVNALADFMISMRGMGLLALHLRKLHGLDARFAMQIIEAGGGANVMDNVESFIGLNFKEIEKALMARGEGFFIAEHLEHFTHLKPVEFADRLIEEGAGVAVAAFLEKFSGVDHRELAVRLIKDNQGRSVAKYFQQFHGLDAELIVDQLIDAGNGEDLLEFLQNFSQVEQSHIISQILARGDSAIVVKHLSTMSDLSDATANVLLDAGHATEIIRYLNKFADLTSDTALRFLDSNIQIYDFVQYLDVFHDLTNQVAESLIDHGRINDVVKRIDKFPQLSLLDLVNNRLEADPWTACQILSSYLDSPKTSNSALSDEKFIAFLNVMRRFQPASISKLVFFFQPSDALMSSDKILQESCESIINDAWSQVNTADYFFERFLANPEQFLASAPGAEKMNAWTLYLLETCIRHASIATKFLGASANWDKAIISLPWIQKIKNKAEKIIAEREAAGVMMSNAPEKIEAYKDVPIRKELLKELENIVTTQGRDSQFLGEALVSFRGDHHLSEREMQAYFAQLDVRIREKNSPSEKQLHAMQLYREFFHGTTSEELSKKNVEELKKVKDAISKLVKNLDRQLNVSVDERDMVINKEGLAMKLRPLEKTLQNLIARYLGEVGIEQIGEVKDLLDRATRLYRQMYDVDFPLYDKLYEEFDELLATGRSPLEVYLGRDGIYAYIGRRAATSARKRAMRFKLGEKKKDQKRSEDVMELHPNPRYLIFPRNYRDYIGSGAKRNYLLEQGTTLDSDPFFYDTGYTGSIPVDMMQVMGFTAMEIEQRIRLLSAQTAERRVRGIAENARSEIVEYIEANVKAENASFTLVRDERSGLLRPLAVPTDAQERFLFDVVKQAAARHYWYRETSQNRITNHVEIRREDYSLTLCEEALALLGPGFLDHATEILQSAEVIKGRTQKDGKILRLSTQDKKTIIAKQVPLSRATSGEHEWRILERARKLGLPGAQVIGILRTENDELHLLMEDVQGLSGRTIRTSLAERGWTPEEVDQLVQDALKRLGDIANDYRHLMQIDKPWHLKDCVIQVDEERHTLKGVIPLDWEEASKYRIEKPHSISEK